ncbi:MAG TPA: hypothetical protein GX505_03775 [Clostridiales bacterium]|nr:hypothetical protein [Clostridiales bacterium]
MIIFGRDGWYGVISDEIGFESIGIVAQAVSDYLNDTPDPGPVVLGYDTRFLSREYAWLIQRVLTANRIRVYMHKKPIPTAFLSLSVQLLDAGLGIMVTGEGRPARYSGMTFRLPPGMPVSAEWMNNLFQHLYRRYPRSSEDSRQLLQYIDIFPEYTDNLGKYIDFELIKKTNPSIYSDSFFGSVGTYMQEILKKYEIEGIHIRTKPNPGFLDSVPQPNERNMNPVSKLVVQRKGDIGLFFSGDGSLIGVANSNGQVFPGMWTSAVILDEWLKINGCDFDVYIDLFTPEIVHSLLRHHGLEPMPVQLLYGSGMKPERTLIWDRHCLTICPYLPDRDGMFQGLYFVQALCRNNLDWKKLTDHVINISGTRHRELKTLTLDNTAWENKRNVMLEEIGGAAADELDEVIEVDQDIKVVFRSRSWLGFSYCSKENSLFLYCDADSRQKTDEMLSRVIAWLTE